MKTAVANTAAENIAAAECEHAALPCASLQQQTEMIEPDQNTHVVRSAHVGLTPSKKAIIAGIREWQQVFDIAQHGSTPERRAQAPFVQNSAKVALNMARTEKENTLCLD